MGTDEFLAACRKLGSLDLSPQTGTRLIAGVEQEMSLRYALPVAVAPAETFDRSTGSGRNRRGQWHELVQHLTDLAYLTVSDFQDWHRRRARDEPPGRTLMSRVVTGCRTFIGEDRSGDYSQLPPFPERDLDRQTEWVANQLSLLIFRGERYTSFDGDVPLDYRYRVGERTALGRSLAFRIRTYFYNFTSPDRPLRQPYFRREDLKFLYTLDNSVGGVFRDRLPARDAIHLHPDLLEVLASADRLLDLYRRANRLTPSSRQGYFWLYRTGTDGGDRDIDLDERRMERLSRRAGRRVRRETFHQSSGTNHLGIRLLQLGLWRAGCYRGRLDGAFGKLTHQAALQLVQQERERGETLRGKQYDRVILPVEDGDSRLWVVDLRLMTKLLEAYAPPDPREAEREEDELWREIQHSGGEDRLERVVRDRGAGWSAAYGELERHPLRRVYYGLRGLIRGAYRAVGRVVNWLVGRVGEVLGAVFDFVKAVVKRIQEGAGLLFAGFRFFAHYLLGRPILTVGGTRNGERPLLLTRHLLDFDVINLASASVSKSDIQRHANRVGELRRGAAYFVEATATLLRYLAALQPPVGWLRLGIYLARRVRRLLLTTTSRRSMA